MELMSFTAGATAGADETATTLLGRDAERRRLDDLLGDVRGGQSAVLVLRGEAGVGKTTLLDHCAERATGFRTVRVAGVEAEMELPFAAAHRLCAPFLDRAEALPAPQRQALDVALGMTSGEVPDRFLIALAALGLLSVAAEDEPLLCLIDDAQWLDGASRQILGFVARRLLAESVALVLTVRDPMHEPELDGLPSLDLMGLDADEARVLFDRSFPGRLDDRVRDRLIAETGGNPLALVEVPRNMSAVGLGGSFDAPSDTGLSERIEQGYAGRIRALPRDTQRLLLLAAAEPVGDAGLLWRAAEGAGLAPDALVPAEDEELVRVGAVVRFRHPLVRSAAYRSATAEARRDAHRSLAESCDQEAHADRRAWHRALATRAADEAVASELELGAERARGRGGLAAAAAFLERATELTPDLARRAGRALDAAELAIASGAGGAAQRLLRYAEAVPLDDRRRAQAQLLRGRAAFGSPRGREATPLLLEAARALEPLDPDAARETLLEALSAALFVGRLAGDAGVVDVARAAPAATTDRPQDLLLDGLATVITAGYDTGAPVLRRAVEAFRAADMPVADAMRWLWLATHAAHDLWDDRAWEELCDRHIALARRAGALSVLPIALSARVGLHLFAGELPKAASLVEEAEAVTHATGSGLPPYGALALAAWRGREAEATALIRAVRSEIGPRGDGMGLTLVEHAEAMLFNGLGRYEEACGAAHRGAAHPQELGFSIWSLPQLVEAAVRSDRPDLAEQALARLTATTSASATPWALAVEARSRALVSDGAEAEGAYRDAIDLFARTSVRGEHARAHLLYGEWLRGEGRRADARDQLRTAHTMLTEMGMYGFAERAQRALAAAGERVRPRAAEPRDDLTPQELQIAELAREGRSNAEIGGELFLSPRTVEWHLKKVFAKLGIGSRMALPDALPDRAQP